jgi:serine/threonine protein kinase
MPAPATADEFLDLVTKSGVTEAGKLSAFADRHRAAGTLPAEPRKLAGLMVREAVLTYFQAEQLLQGKWRRFTIGKYKVLERLGSGGMGQVFLCEHKLMRRRVAVKVLPTAKVADTSALDRFYREGRAAAALDHPNLVRAYDIDDDDGLHFLVMEYVDGRNLQDLVRLFGPLDPVRACHYVYGAAVGLQYAQERGVIHRDIKPGNILIDRTGVVKILDMGLARFFHDEDDGLTRKYDEQVLGTADYLAPEQAVDSHTVDIRADLYSLGGTFYYLLTGSAPFPEGTVAQKLLWHQTRDPKPVRDLRPDVPEEIAAVVAKLMAKAPEDRYQSPGELMAALQPWVQVPIPPPAEKELPQLSPAAAATGGGPPGGRPASGALLAGGSPMAVSVSGSGTGIPILNLPATLGGSTAKAPAAGRSSDSDATGGADAVTADPPPAADHSVWETISAETTAGTASDTAPVPPTIRRPAPRRPSPTSPTASPSRWTRRRIIAAAAGGVAVIAGVGVAAYFLLTGGSTPHPQPGPPAGPRKLYVGKTPGPDPALTFPRIGNAVAKVGPGDTIVLLDDRYEDWVSIQPGLRARLRNVTIEGGTPGRPTVWAAPEKTGPALLALGGMDGMTVRNIRFDGDGRVDVGLMLAGDCPGVRVEDVTVQNVRVAAVRLSGGGDPGRPVRLERVRAVGSQGTEAAVLVVAGRTQPVGHVEVADCRLEGPAAAGVRIDGPVTAVTVEHCRVYNVAAGVRLGGEFGPAGGYGLRLVGNTFHTLAEAGVAVADGPLPAKAEVAVEQNLFVKTAAVVTGPAAGLKPRDNARDAATADGTLPSAAAAVTNPRLPPPNPDDDATFLRYPKSSPLAAFGPRKVPAGVPPE